MSLTTSSHWRPLLKRSDGGELAVLCSVLQSRRSGMCRGVCMQTFVNGSLAEAGSLTEAHLFG